MHNYVLQEAGKDHQQVLVYRLARVSRIEPEAQAPQGVGGGRG